MAKGDPVPLILLVQSNLVQKELTRLGINSIALLNETVNVAPDVTLKLRDLLDREVERHDHEWMETMQRFTITKITEKRPVTIRSWDVVRDCRSIVNQLVNSMPKDVLLRTSYTEHREATNVQTTEEVRVKSESSVTRKIQFTEAKEEYEPCSDSSSGDETLSGESCAFGPGQDDLSGETMQSDQEAEFCPGSRETSQTRNITEYNDVESTGSSDDSRTQSWENTSETTSNSDVSEIAIHSLLVEWKQRELEMHQDPDRDRYISDEEGTVVDNAADELELRAASKRPTRLLPHATVVRTNLEPSVQEATPLKKIWCVNLMDDAHAPEIISGQL